MELCRDVFEFLDKDSVSLIKKLLFDDTEVNLDAAVREFEAMPEEATALNVRMIHGAIREDRKLMIRLETFYFTLKSKPGMLNEKFMISEETFRAAVKDSSKIDATDSNTISS